MFGNQMGKASFTVVLRFVANHPAGIGDAPKGVGVVANAVKNLKRHALFVANIFVFDAFDLVAYTP
jgi:hypothetical protein